MNIQIGELNLRATLVQNSSIEALRKILEKGPVNIVIQDYGGMDKVGSFPNTLPTNDEPIKAVFGILILIRDMHL